jgi:hypothetical protein
MNKKSLKTSEEAKADVPERLPLLQHGTERESNEGERE